MPSTLRRTLLHVVLVTVALVASTTLVTPTARAGTSAFRVLHVAASRQGAPYRYGASGPRAFDCSGFTQWVFARVGRHLPRTSAAQASAVRHVPAYQRRVGDLVFFRSGRHVYHVGIYAGGGRLWHAPRPGDHVRLGRIWTRSVSYGRVG